MKSMTEFMNEADSNTYSIDLKNPKDGSKLNTGMANGDALMITILNNFIDTGSTMISDFDDFVDTQEILDKAKIKYTPIIKKGK